MNSVCGICVCVCVWPHNVQNCVKQKQMLLK